MSCRQRARVAVFAAIAAVALGACSASPTPGLRQVSLPQQEPDPLQAASDREHARILASYGGLYESPRLEAEIDKVVARLVAASERPDLKYKTIILNSPAINAFALPNGQLYVTRGLLALANDEAEIASVLSHEMAHVIARHAAIRENQARQSVTIASVAEVIGDRDLGALALAKSKLALASFSRAQEFEADGIGVGIAARAGLDPYGAVRFLNAMQRNADLKSQGGEPDPRFRDFLSSHPATPDRVKNAQANARQFSGPGTGGGRNRMDYLSLVDGLVYGEDPSEGFARGRKFVHPKLGFTFLAPNGFELENTAQAVLGIRDGGGQALRLDVVQVPAEQSLADYLRSGWMENVDARSIEQFTINGFPAAGATAGGEQWSFHIYALRFGSDVYRFIFAAKQRTPETEKAFRDAVGSFRRLSLKEASEIKPLRIKILTAKAGDTVATLVRRMAAVDKAAERFRVINGLGPHDAIKPGEHVKILVE